jgi:alcohol dehydrogenase YqhD (iron-dependent ADH family)
MQNFTFHNPTRILFGQGRIADIAREIPAGARVLITYGGGSVVRTGTLDEVKAALQGFTVFEFAGIEPNPTYETLMQAVDLARREKIDFLLAVGGGSVIDGTKFIAAAIPFAGDPWDILARRAAVKSAIAFGSVLTLPATGSEMNNGAVVTRRAGNDKLAFLNPALPALLGSRPEQDLHAAAAAGRQRRRRRLRAHRRAIPHLSGRRQGAGPLRRRPAADADRGRPARIARAGEYACAPT